LTQQIVPKLVVDGGRAALDWYRSTLNARIGEVHLNGDLVAYADLVILETRLSLKDGDGADRSAAALGVPGPILQVLVEDPDEIAAAMLEHGAEVIFPVADQDYGARAGRLRDPYGVQWLVSTPVS
jgi:PhnB protein